jgi:hypothetical protein
LNHIKARKLDTFFEVEEKVMGKVALDKGIMDVITDNDSSTPDDKMRLFIIFYICSLNMSEARYLKFFHLKRRFQDFDFFRLSLTVIRPLCKMLAVTLRR